METVDNKAIIVETTCPEAYTSQIKKSAVVWEEGSFYKVAVNWGLSEARQVAAITRVLNPTTTERVPSTILRDYSWTGRLTPFEHQKTTASFLTVHNKAFCFSEMGCVDSETEYLSPTGWQKISEYTSGKVAQYTPGGDVEFVAPSEYVKLPCVDMVRIKTKYGLDQLVSPEHRVLITDGKKNTPKYETLSAEKLQCRHDQYHEGYKKLGGGCKAGTASIAFSGAAIPTAFKYKPTAAMPYTDAQLQVLVAVIADGYFGSKTKHCVVRLKKERKKTRLCQLLNAAGIPYKNTPCLPEGFTKIVFYAPERWKEFGVEFWSASRTQLELLAEESLHWDGCTTRGKRFSTTSKASADFIQFAFCATGRTARISERLREGRKSIEYVVQIRDTTRLYLCSNTSTRTNTIYKTPSTDGYKYCFMVPSTYLVFRRNGCVFLSGNTGKTASVIWAADYLMKIGEIKRVLIICPLSIMRSAWQQDLFKFAMHRSCSIAHGDAKARRKIIATKSEFIIINFDGVAVIEDEIAKGGFDLIVVDESNAYKSAQTKRWKVLNRISSKIPKLWMLTGTPAAQSPTDAYGLAKLVNPDGVPKYFGAFREKVMYKITQFKWGVKTNATSVVHAALQPAIRFERDQCLDLPPVVSVDRDAPLTPQQTKYYKTLKQTMVMAAAGESVTAVNAAVGLNKLLQISGGAVYTDSGEVIEFDVSNRLNAVLEVVQEASHKVLVFVPYTHTIELLQAHLTANGVSADIINGAVPASRRGDIVAKFQSEPDPHVLVIQPQAAAHGLTLTAADTIIWYAPVPSVETYLQANARINRPGQLHSMNIVHIRGSEVENKLYKMLQSGIDTHQQIIDLYREEFIVA